MNSLAIHVITFAGGGVVGFFTAASLLKKKYEGIANEEIASVKETYKRLSEAKTPEPSKKEKDEGDKKQYSAIVKSSGYSQSYKASQEVKPHIISPEEFGSLDGYDEVSISYYPDGTVTDENNVPVSEEWITMNLGGREVFGHFGEYEDDSIFVRDDSIKVDYEILMELRPYSEVLSESHTN